MALADGFGAAARESGAMIVGGDLSAGSELSICITVLGTVEHPLTRKRRAQDGDTLWVTGRRWREPRVSPLRRSTAGLVPLPAHRVRFAHPVPRLREARWLAAHGATAAIDCSDGVTSDASHIAAASRVRIRLDLDRLPLVSGATTRRRRTGRGRIRADRHGAGDILDAAAFEREFSLPVTAIGTIAAAGAEGPGVDAFAGGHPVALPERPP